MDPTIDKPAYDLPFGFYITVDDADTYTLWCNDKFVYWNERLDQVFIVFGRHLDTVKG